MQTITAEYEIITPMFLGDADQMINSIPASSVKGALRFWWRALYWGEIRNQQKNNNTALRVLHEQEALLFGGTAYDNEVRKNQRQEQIAQSRVLLQIQQPKDLKTISNWPTDSNYLGFGLWKTKTTPQREAIKEGVLLTLRIVFRNLSPIQQQQLDKTLTVFGLLGGLGSRSRRAFGSVALIRINDSAYPCITTQDVYIQRLKDIFIDITITKYLPPYTAFSSKSKMVLLTNSQANNARACHAKIGKWYKEYRDEIKGDIRKVFGLPLEGISDSRRASPLFFHIHPIGNQYIGVAFLLPSEIFHPDHNDIDYQLIENLLKGFPEIKLL